MQMCNACTHTTTHAHPHKPPRIRVRTRTHTHHHHAQTTRLTWPCVRLTRALAGWSLHMCSHTRRDISARGIGWITSGTAMPSRLHMRLPVAASSVPPRTEVMT